MKRVGRKGSKLNTKINLSKFKPIPKQIDIISFLKAIQKKFLFVPIDKASNNVAVLCKRYYVEVLRDEIGVFGHGNNSNCKS